MRREAAAVAAVIVACSASSRPLTLGGRLASSADLDAFYAPFATFLHDRLAAGDLPFWAPGAFSGQPFLADAQSGVTYPPMLLAAWLLGPIDALRAVATFHYLIAALGTYALARQLRREPHRVGLRRDRLRGLGAPRRALRGARAAGRRGLARAGPGAGRGHGERAPVAPGLRHRRARGRARAAPGQRIAAAGGAHAGDLRDLAGRARGRARAAATRPSRSRSRSAWRRVALLPRLELLRAGDGVGLRRSRRHRLAAVRRPPRRSSGASASRSSEIATLYLGAATLGARAASAARARCARRRPGAPARVADRASRWRGPRVWSAGSWTRCRSCAPWPGTSPCAASCWRSCACASWPRSPCPSRGAGPRP